MAIPFSRSTRAITGDVFRPSLVGLAIAAILLIAWGVWFVSAKVAVYETSTELQLTRDGSVIAKFAPDAFARIRPGQDVTAQGSSPSEKWDGQVMEVARRSVNRLEPNTVRLYVQSNPPLTQPPSEVRVQVDQLSPLALLLQAGEQTAQK